MRRIYLIVCILLLCVPTKLFAAKLPTVPENYCLVNGNWFNGQKFERKTFYVVSGVLTTRKPGRIDETIDLQNGYVVPPFADAHCHHFDSTYNVAQQVAMYLRDGVFYAKVQTDVRSGALAVANKVNRPDSVDVAYAHGALTHTNGHGIEIYEALALNLYFNRQAYEANLAKIAASRIRENDAYYIIDTRQDLEDKWSKILNGKPDFIKIYLLTSEDYVKKSKDYSSFPLGSIGIDPQLVPLIVQKAHAAGLRVSAHVDTVTDYRIALKGGVDEMAHLPGYYVALDNQPEKFLLTVADARESARRKIRVIPAPIFYGGIDARVRARTDEVLKHNLGLLKKYKVNLAFGSDSYGRTPVADVMYLNQLGVFDSLELLKIWTEDTPRTIFPSRKLGRLVEGYEASFLVLGGNPLNDFEQIKNIQLRFKQGRRLKESE